MHAPPTLLLNDVSNALLLLNVNVNCLSINVLLLNRRQERQV
jgi:hypothetical protein